MTRRQFSARAKAKRLLEFNGRCADCGCKVGGAAGLDFDHIIPLELGGDKASGMKKKMDGTVERRT